MEITLYHNPRCSKSRHALELLQNNNVDVTIVEYLKTPPTHQQLDSLLRGLEMHPRELMRKNESLYKEQGLDDEALTRDQLINAMINNPILIERPILIAGNQITIGRPPENVLTILP